jgi:benzoyl-CoA reductase/2-hydroxyglutaryl-CoA dehydratase subunit BcrC/BadD/HgdB
LDRGSQGIFCKATMKPQALKQLTRIANDPYGCLPDLRKKKRVIGSTLADVPEEMIHAAGLHPFLILGTNEPLRRSSSLLPDNACSLARSNLELVLGAQAAFFDGFVLSQVCDTTQHLSDIWRRKLSSHYFENFLAPRQVARPSARAWYAEESRRMQSALERYTGQQITDQALEESFRLYNENRALLRRLYAVKLEAPGLMSNREFFDMVKASFFMEKEEHNQLLREVLDWAEREKDCFADQQGYFKVIMAGIVVEPPAIYGMIDQVKGNIVADTLCTASRYIYHDVEIGPDPAEALADRHLRKPLFSPINADPERIPADLVELYRQAKAEAIFYCHIKYCEAQDYDLPDIKARMREEGIPFLELETEYQTTHSAQMRTRLEAFHESVISRRGSR